MDLRQLECFVAVCEELHFSRAAEKLHLSQPSLSQHIKNLETKLGTPLFDRMGRTIAVTEAGNILLAHSRRIFHEVDQAQAAIRDLHGLQRGKLAVGSLLTCVSYLLPPTIRKFKTLYPNVELSVLGLPSEKVNEKVLANELDLGITYLPVEHTDLEGIPLCHEQLTLAVRSDHPLALKKAVPLRKLDQFAMVALPKNYFLRTIIDTYHEEVGMTMKPVLEISPLDALVQLVVDGVGAAILPEPYVDHINNPHITRVKIISPTPETTIGMVYRKGKFMCATTRAFIAHLTETAATTAIQPDIKQEAL